VSTVIDLKQNWQPIAAIIAILMGGGNITYMSSNETEHTKSHNNKTDVDVYTLIEMQKLKERIAKLEAR
jgi:hypothetical protein